MDEVTLTLSSPITEEQWDMIADYDFNYTNEITFHTKHGKTVRFVKESAKIEQRWIPCSERLPSEDGKYLIVGRQGAVNILPYRDGRWYGRWSVIAWMLLPKPYKDFSEHMNKPEEE